MKRITTFFLLGIITMSLFYFMPWNMRKARKVAEDYLEEKYVEAMIFDDIRFSWKDPSLYHVFFHPEDNPELSFEVIVLPDDFRLPDYPDDYLIQLFISRVKIQYEPKVKDIWGEEAKIVLSSKDPLYSFQNTDALDADMTNAEMSGAIKYVWYIDTGWCWDNIETKEEAERIYSFIELVRTEKLCIPDMCINYLDNKDQAEVSHGQKKTKKVRIHMGNLDEIESAGDIEQILLSKR